MMEEQPTPRVCPPAPRVLTRPHSSGEDCLVTDMVFSPEKLLAFMADVFEQMCRIGDSRPPLFITLFHSEVPSVIPIKSYLDILWKLSQVSPACLITSLIYIDRIQREPRIVMSSLTVHRLILTGWMIADKFFSDIPCSNSAYARYGGIELTELNNLETEFLFNISFDLNVSREEFEVYLDGLRDFAERRGHGPVLSPHSKDPCEVSANAA